MATYAYGDPHGCYRTLVALRQTMGVTPEDTELYIGDLVDRGPRIRELLDDVLYRKNTLITLSNHDFCWMDYYTPMGPFINKFMLHQGLSETLRQLGADGKRYAARLKKIVVPVIRQNSGKFIFCHADYNWGKNESFVADQNPGTHLWLRISAKTHADYVGPIIVHGHTPCARADMYEYKKDGTLFGINLDGGAFMQQPNKEGVGGVLRAMHMETGDVYEQEYVG